MAVEFFDDNSERNVLSALLNDIAFLEDSLTKTKIYPEDFYVGINRTLHDIIIKFFLKYHALLPQQVLENFLTKNTVQNKAEIVVLYAEVKALTPGLLIRVYVEQLKDYATKRHLYNDVFKPLQEGLQDESSNGTDLQDQLTRTILSTPSTSGIVRASSVFAHPDERINSYIDRRDHPEKYVRMKYGMKELDEATGGMQKQALYMVYGRTGAGKSRMMFNIGCNVAKTGASVLYFTIEMPGEAIQHMWESRELRIALNKITKTPPTLDKEEEARYIAFLEDMKIHKAPFHIVDIASGATTGLIAAEVMKFEKKYGRVPDIVLADYASLIMPMGKHKDRVEKYDHLFKELKELARSHDTIYYTAAQANRDVLKSSKAGTEHVAFSDAASHHCDGVFYIHASEEDEIASQVQFSGVKDRWNQTKTVTLHWNRETNYIGDWGSLKQSASPEPTSTETQQDEF